LAEKDITVELTEAARTWLAEEGYDAAFGARPLRRTLQKYVESPLSKRILQGEFKSGDHVLVDVDPETGEGLRFEKQGPVPVELPIPAETTNED
jgi:ATP-dependent Clp protease ATP-binding subunit ClpC